MSSITNLSIAIPIYVDLNDNNNVYYLDVKLNLSSKLLSRFKNRLDGDEAILIFNTRILPSYIIYDLKKDFHELIPLDYKEDLLSALENGTLMKTELNNGMHFTFYDNIPLNTCLMALFVQSCQLKYINCRLLNIDKIR